MSRSLAEANGQQSDQSAKDLRKNVRRRPHWEWLRLAFELELEPAEKLVLVAYATFTNQVGDSIFPSKNRIAWMCNMSRRHVRTLSAQLVRKGILIEERRKGDTTRYRLSPDLADHPRRVSFAEWDYKQAQKKGRT